MSYKIEAIDKSKAEGDAGLTTFTFKISRDHAAAPTGEFERVMLKLDTPDIDAFDGFSFDSNDGRVFGRDDTRLGVRFDPGDTEKTITVSIRGDTLVENDDIIRLSLTSFGVVNQTNSSVSAKGIDGSASAVVVDDDLATPAKHAAEQFHVDLVLADGIISPYEQKFILNPPTNNDLVDQLIDRIIQNLFASSQDGELDGNELIALDQVFTGNPGVEAVYNPARAQEIAAAEVFDPPAEFPFSTFIGSLPSQLGPSFFNEVLLSDQAFLSVEKNQLVLAGNELILSVGSDQVEIFDPRSQPPSALGNGQLEANVQLNFAGGGSLSVDTDVLRLDGGGEVSVYGFTASDTEVFSGALSDYSVETLPDNTLRVTDNRPGTPDGIKLLNTIEFLTFSTGTYEAAEFKPSVWRDQPDNIELVASTYQFFTNIVPGEAGFEYLIDSVENTQDLNDPYYSMFNMENRYINFANNLGSFGEGKAAFQSAFGALTFEQTVRNAFEQIIGAGAVTTNGGDPEASIQFFLGAEGFYSAVANERVVSSGVSLEQATKVVAIGSILNEAMKADLGRYSEATSAFVTEIQTTGTSGDFGMDLFG